jgi:hypothetical protein
MWITPYSGHRCHLLVSTAAWHAARAERLQPDQRRKPGAKDRSAMKPRCFALWKGDGEADVVCLDVAGVLTGIGQQTHQGRNENLLAAGAEPFAPVHEHRHASASIFGYVRAVICLLLRRRTKRRWRRLQRSQHTDGQRQGVQLRRARRH